MSHTKIIVLADLYTGNKYANFFNSVSEVYDNAPANVKAELLSIKEAPGFCCKPDWSVFDGALYDTLGFQSAEMRQYFLVSDTMIFNPNRKEPPPSGATTDYFCPLLHYPDRVQYAFDNMLTEGQTLNDLTAEQLAELSALGNDYYIIMTSALWGSFSQDTLNYLYANLGTPVSVLNGN